MPAIAIVPKTRRCIRCSGKKTIPYANGQRIFCIGCGFTFHKDSTDESDELIRRLVKAVRR